MFTVSDSFWRLPDHTRAPFSVYLEDCTPTDSQSGFSFGPVLAVHTPMRRTSRCMKRLTNALVAIWGLGVAVHELIRSVSGSLSPSRKNHIVAAHWSSPLRKHPARFFAARLRIAAHTASREVFARQASSVVLRLPFSPCFRMSFASLFCITDSFMTSSDIRGKAGGPGLECQIDSMGG